MAEKVQLKNNVHLLCNESILIDDIHFIGSTFWTNIPVNLNARLAIMNSINDFRRILWGARCGYRKFNMDDWIALHWMAKKYIKTQLTETKTDLKKIVITHHAPSFLSRAEERSMDDVAFSFYSSYDEELLPYADLWIHGHTHDSVDYNSEGCRVVANCRGYHRVKIKDGEVRFDNIEKLEPHFDPLGKLIEV